MNYAILMSHLSPSNSSISMNARSLGRIGYA